MSTIAIVKPIPGSFHDYDTADFQCGGYELPYNGTVLAIGTGVYGVSDDWREQFDPDCQHVEVPREFIAELCIGDDVAIDRSVVEDIISY